MPVGRTRGGLFAVRVVTSGEGLAWPRTDPHSTIHTFDICDPEYTFIGLRVYFAMHLLYTTYISRLTFISDGNSCDYI